MRVFYLCACSLTLSIITSSLVDIDNKLLTVRIKILIFIHVNSVNEKRWSNIFPLPSSSIMIWSLTPPPPTPPRWLREVSKTSGRSLHSWVEVDQSSHVRGGRGVGHLQQSSGRYGRCPGGFTPVAGASTVVMMDTVHDRLLVQLWFWRGVCVGGGGDKITENGKSCFVRATSPSLTLPPSW